MSYQSEYEVRQERSIPVQGRVDFTALADLLAYFDAQGVHIASMSALVGNAVELARTVLRVNGVLVKEHGASEANELLSRRNMYQRSSYARSQKKIMNAIRFENLRMEGVDPQQYVPTHFNVVHNRHSVDASVVGAEGDELSKKALDTYYKLEGEKKFKDQQLVVGDESERSESLKKHFEQFEYDEDGSVVLPKKPADTCGMKPAETSGTVAKRGRPKKGDSKGSNSSEPRKLTDEELESKEREREDRFKRQQEEMDRLSGLSRKVGDD